MLRTSGKNLATPQVSLFLFIKNAVSIIDLVNSKGLVLCHLVIEQ